MSRKLPDGQVYISRTDVRKRFGVAHSTLWKWEVSDEYDFPKPAMRIGKPPQGPLFYRRADIEAWEKRMIMKQVKNSGRRVASAA